MHAEDIQSDKSNSYSSKLASYETVDLLNRNKTITKIDFFSINTLYDLNIKYFNKNMNKYFNKNF